MILTSDWSRAAFTKLAYTKFHNAPLYLEWVPDDTFFRPHNNDDDTKQETEETEVQEDRNQDSKIADKTEVESSEPEPGSTLFVKNLNFSTSDDELLEHFKSCGQVHSANIATKKNFKSDELLSMGYGFVTYVLKSSAEKALKTLQHSR